MESHGQEKPLDTLLEKANDLQTSRVLSYVRDGPHIPPSLAIA